MSNLSTYAANQILDGAPMPATLYLAGYIGNPGPDAIANPATETRRISFARTAAAAGIATQTTAGAITNAAATENWTHFALFDASSGGNPWWVGAFPAPLAVTATETIRLDAATIDLAFTLWS